MGSSDDFGYNEHLDCLSDGQIRLASRVLVTSLIEIFIFILSITIVFFN